MQDALWQQCLEQLRSELPSHQFNTWLKPLSVSTETNGLLLSAPNRFIANWVRDKYLERIETLASSYGIQGAVSIDVQTSSTGRAQGVASSSNSTRNERRSESSDSARAPALEYPSLLTPAVADRVEVDPRTRSTEVLEVQTTGAKRGRIKVQSYLNRSFTFKSFVEGKSNQLALAASQQVAENAGGAYNPLFIYGGVGLGKTHLMQAIGNEILEQNPAAKVVYLHSERFVADMVKALQLNAMAEFKRFYRSLDALLIDDIQFFAKKDRSQEEFFHTFNALLEGNQQSLEELVLFYNIPTDC